MPKHPARKRKYKRNSPKTVDIKKRQAKIRQTFAVLTLLIISICFLSGYAFYKKITQEFASAFSYQSQDLLSQDLFSAAFLVVDDLDAEPLLVKKISLYIFDKDTLKLIIYELPVDTVIDVPGKFGEEPFSHILALGLLEKYDLDASSRLLTESIFKLLAFPVDRYLLVEGEAEDFFKGLLAGRLSIASEKEIYLLKERVRTDFKLNELFDIYRFVRSLPEDRMLGKEVGDTYLENPNLIDEELMDLTFDSELSREKKNIAILNGTTQQGVANFGARVIKNFGGRVVAVGNTLQTYEESIIITDDDISESTRIISQIFGIKKVILNSDALNFDENEINRSDITIIFGLDFATTL